MRFHKIFFIVLPVMFMSLFSHARGSVDAVFMGDSITQFWKNAQPEFFSGLNVNRGISGQTTRQMLLRFQRDVLAVKPRAVHIMAGTNDIAQNEGPVPLEQTYRNIVAMAEQARVRGIRVVIGSTLPASQFSWRPSITGAAEKIKQLNVWLKNYCVESGCLVADYYSLVEDGRGGMKKELAPDGVHPNRLGYEVMRPTADAALAAVLNP